ncbi:MAG TPA: RIP metalloprotease RseP [Pseudolabrys sp.]|nr:RIP metalloprotease RseP [Pseudolabrys sp.]
MQLDVFAALIGFGGPVTHYGIPFVFGLSVVVFFHELGHFLVARWCGVRVLVFSLGFGPELLGFNDKHGTRWKLSAIPLGGYVKFFGDESVASTPDHEAAAAMTEAERAVSFNFQPLPSRAAVVAAGPIANFILAIVIFSGIFMVYGKQTMSARVDTVTPGSAAAAAGFQPGDVVVAIDGRKIDDFADMQHIVSTSAGETLRVEIDRGNTRRTLTAVPELKEVKDAFGNVHRVGQLGISRATVPGTPVSFPTAIGLGVERTWSVIEQTFGYLGRMFAGRESPDQVGGVLRIGQVLGQAASLGFATLLDVTAVLSVSIGLLNLFPIPLLDGGHLLFYGIEAVRGRPLSERAMDIGFRIGLAIVVMLMIFATFNDILHLTTS